MVEDNQLIRQYAAERSEPAFAELVRRHLKMVYAAALRQVNGDTHLAEDVAQTVFTDFARKARKLQHNRCIAGWLFTSARFAGANAVRSEARRRAREQAVVAMNQILPNANDGWNELRPVIDEALGELGDSDREAIVLRYFESCEFSLVGAALGVSENAARMRVERALEKLRAVLQKRGLAATDAALGAALAHSPGAAAPVELAARITRAALAQSAAASAGSPASILKIMAMKKISLAASAVLSFALATVLLLRSLPHSPPPNVAASPKAAQTPAVQPGLSAQSPVTRGDPDAFQKLVRRHDEQVRARGARGVFNSQTRWDKSVAEFDDSLAPEPGVKKFGARVQATLAPGETLVTGGWSSQPGTRTFVFVTPRMITPTGDLASEGADQVTITSRFIAAPDAAFESLGMPGLGLQNESTLAGKLSDEQTRSLLAALETNSGSQVLSAPRVTSLL